jgi:hypothetical protein
MAETIITAPFEIPLECRECKVVEGAKPIISISARNLSFLNFNSCPSRSAGRVSGRTRCWRLRLRCPKCFVLFVVVVPTVSGAYRPISVSPLDSEFIGCSAAFIGDDTESLFCLQPLRDKFTAAINKSTASTSPRCSRVSFPAPGNISV